MSYSSLGTHRVVRATALVSAALLSTSLLALTGAASQGQAAPVPQQRAASSSLKVATYNVQKDSLRSWKPRRAKVASLLRTGNADAFAIQEANGPHKGSSLKFPARDLDNLLGPYTIVKTRIDRGTRQLSTTGRYIFYKPARLTPGRSGEMSLGGKQYAVWSEMTDRATGSRFMMVNAHLVNGNTAARDRVRRAQTRTLVAKTRTVNTAGLPLVVAGDFNTHRDHASDAPTKVLKQSGFVNSYDVAAKRVKSSYSSNNQLRRKPPRKYLHADYVWVSRGTSVSRWSQAIRLRKGKFVGTIPSDHNPVFASIRLPYKR
ncbi:endonuclease/exonuclease/phosphatase family protein [Solicola sp. PLA-1-18]|uniref:endonuclease/exonuclease/phosphatase family protein n=1 Tax=Solicola sp. PLA-1-18 TaxID=3380532 RepID=UPI003B78AFA9